MASMMDRWLAATELVRAQDQAREAAQCGRARQTDADRLQAANDRWDYVNDTEWWAGPGVRAAAMELADRPGL